MPRAQQRPAVRLPLVRATTPQLSKYHGAIEADLSVVQLAESVTTHTVSPYTLHSEPDHWKVFLAHKEHAQATAKLTAVNASDPLSRRRNAHGTAADRIEASWSLYDAMNQTLPSASRDATAAVDILHEIGRYRHLADVFKQLDDNHDGVVTRDELVACAAKCNIPLTAKDTDALMMFMDRNRDGTVTTDEVDVLVKQFGGASPSPPREKSSGRPVPSRRAKATQLQR